MRDNGLSQTGAFKQLGAAVGLGPESRSAFLPYLYNKPVDPEHEQALADIIGWPPDDETTAPIETPDLATALLALATELTALREERQLLAARLDEVEAQVAELVAAAPSGSGSAAPAAPVVPRASAGSGR